jgi:MFS family permease
MVWGLSVISGVIFGTTICALGIFIVPVMQTFECTSEQAARAATFFILAMFVAAPGVGWLLDRVSARAVIIPGILVMAGGYLGAAASRNIHGFTVAMAVGGAGVGACTYVPASVVIANWFDQKRGRAFGILLGVQSVGSAAFPWLISHSIENLSWRTTLLWIAASGLIVCLPIAAGVRTRPAASPSSRNSFREGTGSCDGLRVNEALGRLPFWLLGLGQIFTGVSFQGTYLYIVPYLSTVGYDSNTAASLYGLENLASLPGYLIFGWLADRWGAKAALILGLLICATSAPLLLFADPHQLGLTPAVAFAILWGATAPLPTQLVPLLLADAVGLRHFGILMGTSSLLYGLAMAAGPLMVGSIYDATHSYSMGIKLCAICMALGVIPIALLVRKEPRWNLA